MVILLMSVSIPPVLLGLLLVMGHVEGRLESLHDAGAKGPLTSTPPESAPGEVIARSLSSVVADRSSYEPRFILPG